MREVVVISPNRVGVLADISEKIGGRGINITSISAYENGGNAVVRILTNDSVSAVKALSGNDWNVLENEVVIVRLDDRPGELGKLTRKLSLRGLNLESVYIVKTDRGSTDVALVPERGKVVHLYETLKELGYVINE